MSVSYFDYNAGLIKDPDVLEFDEPPSNIQHVDPSTIVEELSEWICPECQASVEPASIRQHYDDCANG